MDESIQDDNFKWREVTYIVVMDMSNSSNVAILWDLYKRGHLKRYINPDSKQDLDFISTKHIDESKIHEIENNPTET